MPSTVLVVDDDPVILQLLEINFELEGFRVLTAADGEEALAVARAEMPDIIVTDIMMPKRSGLDLLADLRAGARDDDTDSADAAADAASELARIPVILLSAKAQTGDIREGLDAGADDYITKPFEPHDLVERVNRLIAEAAKRRTRPRAVDS